MAEKTREDVMQNKRLDRHDERLGAEVDRLGKIEDDIASLKEQARAEAMVTVPTVERLNALEREVDELRPLKGLADLVETIKHHFSQFRTTH